MIHSDGPAVQGIPTVVLLISVRLILSSLMTLTAVADPGQSEESWVPRQVVGWSVYISPRLLEEEAPATEKALTLLARQLEEIRRTVPPASVSQLQQVPLYFSPTYPGLKPRAEFHPDAGWLRANNRDPKMAEGIEFSNIPVFEAEMSRMPNFALHELAHAWHYRFLPNGFENAEIRAAFERASADGKYEVVARRHGSGRPETKERAYAMQNPMEYFAETSEAYFSANDFFPFTRSDLKEHDQQMYELLGRLWASGESYRFPKE